MPTLHNMRKTSGGSDRGNARNEPAAARASINIKQEDDDDDDNNNNALPTLDPRAVSPGASPTPDASKCMRYDDGEDKKYHDTKGMDSKVSASSSAVGEPKPGHERGFVLSLNNEKYKKIINFFWEELWGGSSKGGGPRINRHNTLQKLFDEVTAEMKRSGESKIRIFALAKKTFDYLKTKMRPGGNFYKGRDSDSLHRVTETQAVQKIRDDLGRGKKDYNFSIYSKSERSSEKETDAGKDDENDAPALPIATPKGPTKMKPPNINEKSDLVISLVVKKYERSIADHVKKFMLGRHGHSLSKIASVQVEAVRKEGGKFYKLVNPGSRHVEVNDDEAKKKIIRNVREKLSEARKDHRQVLIVNMKNEEYKNTIQGAIDVFYQDNDKMSGNARAEQICSALLSQLQGLGITHFFKHAGDEKEMLFSEAREKITKDVQAQVRYYSPSSHSTPLVINNRGDEETFISSTRKKRKSAGNSTIHDPPRYYMAQVVSDILRTHGWSVKRNKQLELDDVWVARMNGSGSENTQEWYGYDEILDQSYLCGIYEEHVVGTEDGKGYLYKAGLMTDPYSIFSEELKRGRKRRKQGQEQTNSLQSVCGDEVSTSQVVANGSENNSNSPADNIDDSTDGTRKKSHKSKTQSPDRAASVSGVNHDQGTDGFPYNSPDANSNQKDNSSDLQGVAEEAIAAKSDGQKLSAAPFSDADPEPAKDKTMAGNTLSQQNVSRRGLYRQMYNLIRAKLSATKRNVNGSQKNGGSETLTNKVEEVVQTLQSDFYSHLKGWLLPRVKSVSKSDLEETRELTDEFESAITELKRSENSDDVSFFSSDCECIIEDCKSKFPV